MTPLMVTAELVGPISLPRGPLALDALLASQVALRLELPPPRHADDCVPIDIPVKLDPGGRFHLCSFSVAEYDASALRYVNRRAPVEQYQTIGEKKIRRVQINGGQNKSYRIPNEVKHAVGDTLTWWCVGDAEQIRDLLSGVLYLGKRRAVGIGKVGTWRVEECVAWEGFPVVHGGRALRPLPPDWPGLESPRLEMRTMSMPYWAHGTEELCACP